MPLRPCRAGPPGAPVTGVVDDPAERELAAEDQEVSSRASARGDRALAVPDELAGRAPSESRQRLIPHAMSGNSLEKTSAPAKARE